MIAIDTSSLIAYLNGEEGPDVEWVDEAFRLRQAFLPPVVVTDILSIPGLDPTAAALILGIPILEPESGYWERAGTTRAGVLSKGLRARLADTLIAQSCLDRQIPLVTRNADFRHFAAHSGLVLK